MEEETKEYKYGYQIGKQLSPSEIVNQMRNGIIDQLQESQEDWNRKEVTVTKESGFTIPTRVLNKTELRNIVREICGVYASVVGQTYGPGGKDAIIQFPNGVFTTKDGWTVAKNLSLGLDADLNALGRMILDVAANVNLKVGDCTTTAILAASYLNLHMMHYTDMHPEIPMFTMKECIVKTVDLVCDKLLEEATPVNVQYRTKEEIADIIHKIALVSTNWNTEYADMIRNIYKETGNPYIRVESSGSDESYVSFMHGYDMKGGIQLRDYYINDIPNGLFKAESPLIMMFDYDLPGQMFVSLATIADVLASKGTTFVVMAPGFQVDFIKNLHDVNMRRSQAHMASGGKTPGIVNLVPVKVEIKHPTERSMYDDLRIIVDGQTINKDNQEISAMFDALRNAMMEKPPEKKPDMAEDVHEALVAQFWQERRQVIDEAYEYLRDCCGTCDKIEVSDKLVTVEVDGASEKPAIKERADRLVAELDRVIKQCDSLSMILRDVSDYRTRISKLSCNSGIIHVGGYGDADLQAAKDSLDDAISACRSAYDFGYTVGGNYAVLCAIDELTTELNSNVGQNFHGINGKSLPIIRDILDMIEDTFISCVFTVASNFFDADVSEIVVVEPYNDQTNEISFQDAMFECVERGEAYDVINQRSNPDLIEPVIASVEVLKGSMRLVKLIASSSQYLYKNFTTEELIGAKDIQK